MRIAKKSCPKIGYWYPWQLWVLITILPWMLAGFFRQLYTWLIGNHWKIFSRRSRTKCKLKSKVLEMSVFSFSSCHLFSFLWCMISFFVSLYFSFNLISEALLIFHHLFQIPITTDKIYFFSRRFWYRLLCVVHWLSIVIQHVLISIDIVNGRINLL